MIDERQEELASLYAVGALPPDEAKAFEAELEKDADLRQLTAQLREASAALALSSPPAAPSPELRQKVLAALPDTHKVVRLDLNAEPRKRGLMTWLPWAMAASLAICTAILFQKGRANDYRRGLLTDQIDAQGRVIVTLKLDKQKLEREAQLAQTRVTEVLQRLNAQAQLLTVATNEVARLEKVRQLSEMRIAMLTATGSSSSKTMAVSLWDSKRQEGMFIGQDLATLPADKDYQLWIMDQGKPVAAGILTIDAEGRVRITFKPELNVGNADRFAVTIEKKGGEQKVGDVPAAPKGDMVLIGTWL